jgi:hypothetical protein
MNWLIAPVFASAGRVVTPSPSFFFTLVRLYFTSYLLAAEAVSTCE